jgi:hypothetical protein
MNAYDGSRARDVPEGVEAWSRRSPEEALFEIRKPTPHGAHRPKHVEEHLAVTGAARARPLESGLGWAL